MTTLYRALLHLFPGSFRNAYGEEMVEIFAARLEGHSAVGRLLIFLGAVAEEVPNALAAHWELLRQDIHFSLRTLWRSKAFSMTAIVVTAIGVGANTAAFSAADFVLFRPLPYQDADELVRLCEGPVTGGGWGCNNELSPANYRDLKAMSSTFESLGVYLNGAVNISGTGEPIRVASIGVSAEVLPLLGVAPMLGRVFDAGGSTEDLRTTVIGYGLWRERFGSDSAIVGRALNLNGIPHTVIGVMPPRFQFPHRAIQVWTPLELAPGDYEDRDDTYLHGIGRLKDGVTFEQGKADLIAAAARLSKMYPETNSETGVSYFRLRDSFSPRYETILIALCGASLSILLIACANLANLLLVKAASRGVELDVRAALGAGRERLVRQMITESLVLAFAGSVLGILLALAALPFFATLIPGDLPVSGAPSLDLRMLTLALGFAGITGVGFGLVPALRAGAATGFTTLRSGSRTGSSGARRLRTTLVAAEVALSVALLITSGLMVRAITRVNAVDPGFRPEGVLAVRTALPRPKYEDATKRRLFYDRVLGEVRALPGVRNAAYVTGLPMEMRGGVNTVEVSGEEQQRDRPSIVSVRFVTPGYFATMGIPLLRGRDVQDADLAESPWVAVVSESFVERYWPNQDGLGRTFRHLGRDRVVVGVVGDIKVRGRERVSEPQMYFAVEQIIPGALTFYDAKELVIRAAGSTEALVTAVRRIVRGVDVEQPVSNVRTLEDILAGETASRRAQIQVLGTLTSIALLLSVIGIHGLLAYAVSRRSREIGVRLAFGAAPGRVAWMIVREGLYSAAIGIPVGVALAYASAQWMRNMLFGVPSADIMSIVVAALVTLAATLLGTLVPARRAMQASPLSAIQAE